jgi:hypothetical protein
MEEVARQSARRHRPWMARRHAWNAGLYPLRPAVWRDSCAIGAVVHAAVSGE